VEAVAEKAATKKTFTQPCYYADIQQSTKTVVACRAFGKAFPRDHCGPRCEAYTPEKGNA
jgi:hypothetical protein